MGSEYERQRELNKRKNQELLLQLGLDRPFFEPPEQLSKKDRKDKAAPKKRKAVDTDEYDEEREPSTRQKILRESNDDSTVRRSSRLQRKQVGEALKQTTKQMKTLNKKFDGKETKNSYTRASSKVERTQDPKTYGHIPGIDIGSWWQTREACSLDAVHAPWVAGISSGPKGAYSVVLSGGYDDDVDLGYAFTYTGSGGRELRTKNYISNQQLRTAPQSFDQDFENSLNAALKRSAETKKPIRVVRGFKNPSEYAPSEGYRYDGLYVVEKAWIDPGNNPKKYKVCKFAFKRLPNQTPLCVRADLDEGSVENVSDSLDKDTESESEE